MLSKHRPKIICKCSHKKGNDQHQHRVHFKYSRSHLISMEILLPSNLRQPLPVLLFGLGVASLYCSCFVFRNICLHVSPSLSLNIFLPHYPLGKFMVSPCNELSQFLLWISNENHLFLHRAMTLQVLHN